MILIGIPETGVIAAGLTRYLLNLRKDVVVLFNEDKWLCDARNQILEYGLSDKEFSHLLFIDSDLYPSPKSDILERMLKMNKDIVCAPYFLNPCINPKTGEVSTRLVEYKPMFYRSKNLKPIYEVADLTDPQKEHIVEGWLPIGFSLIKLDALRDFNEDKWFGSRLSIHEDKTFALKLLKHGIKFWYIPLKVTHRVVTTI